MASNVGGIGDAQALFTPAELTQLKTQIETANPRNKFGALGSHAYTLLHQGNTGKALQVATVVEDVKVRTELLSQMTRMLASAQNFAMAMVFAKQIPPEEITEMDWVLGVLSERIAEHGDVQKALQVAQEISKPCKRSDVISAVAKKFFDKDPNHNTEEALKLVRSLPSEREESNNYDLKFMAIRLAKEGHLVKAREIINSMPETGLGRLVKANALLVLNAIETTSPISDELQKSNALMTICRDLVAQRKELIADEILWLIPNEQVRAATRQEVELEKAKNSNSPQFRGFGEKVADYIAFLNNAKS